MDANGLDHGRLMQRQADDIALWCYKFKKNGEVEVERFEDVILNDGYDVAKCYYSVPKTMVVKDRKRLTYRYVSTSAIGTVNTTGSVYVVWLDEDDLLKAAGLVSSHISDRIASCEKDITRLRDRLLKLEYFLNGGGPWTDATDAATR